MSTRCYDTDLNDAAWAWIAPYLPATQQGGRSRTTNLRAVLNATTALTRIDPYSLRKTEPLCRGVGRRFLFLEC